jgi:hypothetical protein
VDVCLRVFVLCCPVYRKRPCVGLNPNQGVLPNVCGSRSPLRKATVRKGL